MSPFNRKLGSLNLLFLVFVSFFGLLLSVLLALYPPVSQENFAWREPLVGSAFGIVCLLGILAVFFPNTCSKFFNIEKKEKRQKTLLGFTHRNKSTSDRASLPLRGHHPTCGRFSAHVFGLGGRVFCATCSGLFLGAIVVLGGVAVYFFGNWQIEQNAFLLVLVGVAGVTLGLLQSPLQILQHGSIRLFSSFYFVVGTFLILVGIEELTRNTSLDLFLVVLSVFWLATRIQLSQWDHERTCSKCTPDSCSFAESLNKKGS